MASLHINHHFHSGAETEDGRQTWHAHAGNSSGHRHVIVVPESFGDAQSHPTLPYQRMGETLTFHGASGKAFQKFTDWLKREPFHRRGEYCPDDDCAYCIAVRDIVQANKKLEVDRAALRAGQPVFCARCLELTQALSVLNARSKRQEDVGTCVGIPCTYQQPWPCSIEACEEIWCGEDGFRNFCYPHAARMKTYYQKVCQGYGREAGHQIAVDALVALASTPYPVALIDGVGTAEETREAKHDFDLAARVELLKTVRESIDAS